MRALRFMMNKLDSNTPSVPPARDEEEEERRTNTCAENCVRRCVCHCTWRSARSLGSTARMWARVAAVASREVVRVRPAPAVWDGRVWESKIRKMGVLVAKRNLIHARISGGRVMIAAADVSIGMSSFLVSIQAVQCGGRGVGIRTRGRF
jgi:hypothetical protein